MVRIFATGISLVCVLLVLVLPDPGTDLFADQRPSTGPETGLPMPRFVSIKSGKANLRAGPGRNYPIRWVYQRRNLPVRIHDEHGHWRAVTGPWGGEGWLHKSLLSGRRTAIVMKGLVPLLPQPTADASPVLYAEERVIGTVETCDGGWCRMSISGRAGWMSADSLFGSE